MRFERITCNAISTLDRVGLGSALNGLAELLDSADGQEKHGDHGWRTLTQTELHSKALSHFAAAIGPNGVDSDSGKLAILHAVSRCLMIAQKEMSWLNR